MSQLHERNNIDVPGFARREKYGDPERNSNTMQFEGNDAHYLVTKIKYVSNLSYFDTHFDIS